MSIITKKNLVAAGILTALIAGNAMAADVPAGVQLAEKQTLVFYMGLNQAATIQQKLIEHGMPGEMPVAIVENGTAVTQRVIDGTLTQLGELAQQMNSPSLIIIGRVVGLRDKLNWFSNH